MEEILFHLNTSDTGLPKPSHLIWFLHYELCLTPWQIIRYSHAKLPGIFLHRFHLLQLWCMTTSWNTLGSCYSIAFVGYSIFKW